MSVLRDERFFQYEMMYTDAVDQGAEYLDAVCPGWEWEIDLDTLSMSSGVYSVGVVTECGCITAQLDFRLKGSRREGYWDDSLQGIGLGWANAVQFGLTIDISSPNFTDDTWWGVLDRLWTDAILDRRAESLLPL